MARQPSRAQIEQIAARRPDLLNVLVAYFVMEWRSVRRYRPLHGRDQDGAVRRVPNYVRAWGVDACVQALREAPAERGPRDPGGLSRWLENSTSG